VVVATARFLRSPQPPGQLLLSSLEVRIMEDIMPTCALDAVLPLVARDVERFERLLLPSLRHFFNPLGTCWVVVPQANVEAIRNHIADPQFQVISETDLIPELRLFRPERIGGWQLQQLIKLSAARIVSSSFYLTLDADVVCVRHIEYTDLVQDLRAIANVSDSARDVHSTWYTWAEKVLGFARSGRTHGVTPAVLSSEGVCRLFAFFEEQLRPNLLRAEAYLLSHRPWTEYTLYYTYLEHIGLFDTYHFPASTRTYQNSIWKVGEEVAWDPVHSFSAHDSFYFSVLQSYAVNSVDSVVARIRSYYQSIGEPSPF
jgi:hypothetical protein